MKVKLIIITLFVISFSKLFAQDYFQQQVNYNIKVSLNDSLHELNGFEEIEYINNSSQELSFLYFHLYSNAYKDQNSHLAKQMLESGETKFHWSKSSDRGFIDELDFKIENNSLKWNLLKDSNEIAIVYLDKKLLPNVSVKISTPFHVKIPSALFSRLGHLGQQYQITQWYPKPAVFDNLGWHPLPYLNQGEFYSEYGNYDVRITLPQNYVIGATGDLVDGASEIAWMNEKAKLTDGLNDYPRDMSFPKSSKELKTLHFHQEKVHDFAWFADKRYNVAKSEVTLPHSNNKVITWALFTNSEANLWQNGVSNINDAIYYYSLWNGDYPYKQCTAVDGLISAGGGMEYPNVTVIGESSDKYAFDEVIAHEVGHNWFYGILGSNERDHAWMDEGINSFNEMRYMKTKYPNLKLLSMIGAESLGKAFDMNQYYHNYLSYFTYLFSARQNSDQPLSITSAAFSEYNYGACVYMKTAVMFEYLRAYLGTTLFDSCMHNYFETWKFKHPQPKDIQEVFEKVSGKKLNWFFDDMINSNKKIDYRILNWKNEGENTFVKIKNNSNIVCPVNISGVKEGKLVDSKWFEGFEDEQWLQFPTGNYDEFKIDFNEEIPEINRKNNNLKTKGLFRKREPIKLQFLGSVENSKKNQLFYAPIVGLNANNGFMAGLALYNSLAPQRNFEYVLAPMFGMQSQSICGSAQAHYNWFNENGPFSQISFGIVSRSYSLSVYNSKSNTYDKDLSKIQPELILKIKQKNARNNLDQKIIYRDVLLANSNLFNLKIGDFSTSIHELKYTLTNGRVINQFAVALEARATNDFIRSSIEVNYSITYPNQKNKAFDVRFYAGIATKTLNYGFSLDGNNDYLFDKIAYDRGRNFVDGRAQVLMCDGGFRNPTFSNASASNILSLNLTAAIPKLPLAIYTDLGHLPIKNAQQNYINAGIAIILAKNIFELYLPLYDNGQNLVSYPYKIRFQLNLDPLNPLKFLKNLKDEF